MASILPPVTVQWKTGWAVITGAHSPSPIPAGETWRDKRGHNPTKRDQLNVAGRRNDWIGVHDGKMAQGKRERQALRATLLEETKDIFAGVLSDSGEDTNAVAKLPKEVVDRLKGCHIDLCFQKCESREQAVTLAKKLAAKIAAMTTKAPTVGAKVKA